MSSRLTAYIHGLRVGAFARQGGGGIDFTFDDEWRESALRLELSLSMPKSRRNHTGDAPENYLWNLLPDNDAVLHRWGTKFSVSPRNPMALLEHVGLDTAGAVQLSTEDTQFLTSDGGLEAIGDQEIASHIRELRTDPEAWLIPGHTSGYFSLAGAQSKFALARDRGSWAVPVGRSASTHIFKPGIRGLDHSDLNEHLTMSAARHLGLDVAHSQIARFEDETAIVVERYDRERHPDGTVDRLHQEDMAQALGLHPSAKYQNEGGPGLLDIAALLDRVRTPRADVAAFFEAVLFNWVVLGTDAHGKNYSLLHNRALGTRLAPLYDVASALPYPDINNRRAKLAMSFGGHYRQFEIEPRHILADAVAVGLDPESVHERARSLTSQSADAYLQAIREAELTGDDSAFAARLVDETATRSQRLARELSSFSAAELRPAAAKRTARRQPRNKDAGISDNPGAFARGPE